MKALIIIDVQNDFMPGGALEVPHGDEIVPVINSINKKFELVIATQDWHPLNHVSFASNHMDKKPFDTIKMKNMKQTLWPDHCVQGSLGADFHPDLSTYLVETIFRKGTDSRIDSYSAFYDNTHQKSTGLTGYLKEKGVTCLYFCGLAADICVYFSIKDALQAGFNCFLIEDATRALHSKQFKRIKKELLGLDVAFINSVTLE